MTRWLREWACVMGIVCAIVATPTWGADAARGQMFYTSICALCHGPAEGSIPQIRLASANGDPQVILNAINSQPQMAFLRTIIGAADAADIAAFLHPVRIDLHQHGLTGSWYQPTTSGQGIEIEIYPNLVAPGTGLLQGAWFTFDHAAPGGAAAQRWYTFDGSVPAGASSATFTLYQNVGGNFNALPITQAVPVGSVALTFADCTNATMTYAFSDGSARTGSIPLVRLIPNVTCSTTGSSTNADFALSGNWYEPAKSGQGLVLELNPVASFAFFAWYTYAPNGASQGAAGQRWYTGQGAYSPGARTLSLPLYETTGGLFNSTMPAAQHVEVGSATLVFASCNAAQLAFNFTGGSNAGLAGTINLTRVGPTPAGCGP